MPIGILTTYGQVVTHRQPAPEVATQELRLMMVSARTKWSI